MVNEKHGLDDDFVEGLAEDIKSYVSNFEDDYGVEGVSLWKLEEFFKDVSSRHMRQAVARNLRKEEMYRTRVDRKEPDLYTGRLVDPAVTTKGPGRDMTEELEIESFQESGTEGFSEEYKIYHKLGEIENPEESKYGTPAYSFFPELVMDHMERHEEVEFWTEDKKEGTERAEVSWYLKGVDPESREREREMKYIIESKNGETTIEVEFISRKLKYEDVEFWGLDPLNSKGYMGKLLDFSEGSPFSVLKERARKIEEWSEKAADIITDEEKDYELKDFLRNIEAYKSYFSDEVRDFDFCKKNGGIPITSDPLLVELDSKYIHNLKDEPSDEKGGKAVSPTKIECLKDTKTSEINYKAPIRKFLELLEDTAERKVKSKYKQ